MTGDIRYDLVMILINTILTTVYVIMYAVGEYKSSNHLHRGESIDTTYLKVIGVFIFVIKYVMTLVISPIILVIVLGYSPIYVVISILIIGLIDLTILYVIRRNMFKMSEHYEGREIYSKLPVSNVEFVLKYKKQGKIKTVLIVINFVILILLLIALLVDLVTNNRVPYVYILIVLFGVTPIIHIHLYTFHRVLKTKWEMLRVELGLE